MPNPVNSVTISKLLKPNSVMFFPGTHEKTEIIESLVRRISESDPELNVKTAIKKIMDR